MGKMSGRQFVTMEFVDAIRIISPQLEEFFERKILIAVSDLECYREFIIEDFDFGVRPGDKFVDYAPERIAIKEKKKIVIIPKKEEYGVACKATYIPIEDETHNIIGCLGVIIDLDVENSVKEISQSLDKSLEDISEASGKITALLKGVDFSQKELVVAVEEAFSIVQDISEVLNGIRKIADATKMLGLNAALEAARAAEFGRGFGVVAKEIQKLADESKATAGEISFLNQKIKVSMDKVRAKTDYTIKASKKQIIVIEHIETNIKELNTMTSELNKSTDRLVNNN